MSQGPGVPKFKLVVGSNEYVQSDGVVHTINVESHVDMVGMLIARFSLGEHQGAPEWSFGDAVECTFGDAGCLSFHVTKNLGCGEGGALLLNDRKLAEACEIIQEKGTNRSAFLRGQIDKYTWVGPGGSHILSDLLAALLEAQLKRCATMTKKRVGLWERYHAGLAELEALGVIRCPHLPKGTDHNGHIYALRATSPEEQQRILAHLRGKGIGAVFHFQPLHDSPYAKEHLSPLPKLPETVRAAETLIRLPLYHDLKTSEVDRIVAEVYAAAIQG